MPPVTQRSFAGGELLDALYARQDLDRYGQSLKVCQNVLSTRHGLLVKRPGMEYCDLATYSTAGVRKFIPFIFSDDQSYLIVVEPAAGALSWSSISWGHIYYHGAKVAQATPDLWTGSVVYKRGDYCLHAGVIYQALDGTEDNEPDVSPTKWEAYAYCRVPLIIGTTNLGRLQWAQSGDIITLTAGTPWVQQIRRLAHNNWESVGASGSVYVEFNPDTYKVSDLAVVVGQADMDQWHPKRDWEWEVRIVYRYSANEWVEQKTGDTTTGSGVRAVDIKACTLTWTVPTAPAGAATLTADNHFYRVYCGRNGVRGLVGEVDGAAEGATVTFDDDGHEPNWTDGLTSPLDEESSIFGSSSKCPKAVAYYEGREVFGGSTDSPTGLWISNANTFKRFAQQSFGEGLATDGISVRLGAHRFEEIRSLVSCRRLIAFTSGAEWHVGPPAGTPFTRFTMSARAFSHHGSGYLAPLVMDDAILFVDKSGNTVRELRFAADGDGHETRDLSLLARHLLDGHEIVDWTFQSNPEPIVWMVRDDGLLLSMTYSPNTETVAWARHTTVGTVENVCCVPEGTTDIVYLCVLRNLQSGGSLASVRTIEKMVLKTMPADAREARHLDCAVWGWDGRPSKHAAWPETLTLTAYDPTVEIESTGAFSGCSSDWAAADGTRLVLKFPSPAEWNCLTVYALNDLVTYNGVVYQALAENANVVPPQDSTSWQAIEPGGDILPAADLVLSITSINDNKIVCSVVSGGDSIGAFDGVACEYEVQKSHIHGCDRFEGEAPLNGLTALPYFYVDGVPTVCTSTVALGVVTAGYGTIIGLGFEFNADLELLDPPTAERGIAQKMLRTIAWDVKTAGRPAMGASLTSLTEAEVASPASLPYERKMLFGLTDCRYKDEVTGALRQQSPHPLQVYRVAREVEIGGT